MRTTGRVLVASFLLFSLPALAQIVNDPSLIVETVVSGLDFPTTMAFIGNDDILVLEQHTGRIVRINGVIAVTARYQTFPLRRHSPEKPPRTLYIRHGRGSRKPPTPTACSPWCRSSRNSSCFPSTHGCRRSICPRLAGRRPSWRTTTPA